MKSSTKNQKLIGTATLGVKGQIVIPIEIREMFDLAPGDQLLLMADKNKGIALMKSDFVESFFDAEEKR